jgi:serine/threonine protein phosphatase PrpC
MVIHTALLSRQGGREYNEDSARCFSHGDVCVAVIADGLGGHGGGAQASAIMAESVTEAFLAKPSLDPAHIRDILEKANALVVAGQTPGVRMMSTGVCLFTAGGSAVFAHAGDSRLYHFQDGELRLQTLDHSVSQMAVFAGEITAEQIRHHPDRHKVLKAFGEAERFAPEITPPRALEPAAHHAFLLCSDGFWEYVTEPEMARCLAANPSPRAWLQAMASVTEARAPADRDNYSAAAVFITPQ